ncbi:arsenate reductase (glutaredoxin) [Modicisalibacter luteus]|uniref:Arsenate reductase n=1 Tax=Modicisalibacter luteus TaxID=453962 RepID=A0ABV7M3F4_9GAMM|nr:arsenate reductase (glutaredoxin) [Halomonas lutea]GHA86823.1 arsenate reductase [Halomonas lutea]
MAALILYHNPRCSKSREALALLTAHDVDIQVRRYLDDPLDLEELRSLAARLDAPVASMVRSNEAEWKALSLSEPDDEACLSAIAKHPRLLQRPILDRGDRAVIGRSPEAILTLLDSK